MNTNPNFLFDMNNIYIILGCIFYSTAHWIDQIDGSRLYESCNVSLSYILIPNNETGMEIGRILIEKRIAARVTIIPDVSSVYDFKSSTFVKESLMLVIFKTSIVQRLWVEIQRKHPQPAIDFITFPVKQGNQEFIEWALTLVPEIETQITVNETLLETTTARKKKRTRKKATTKARKKHSHSKHHKKPPAPDY